MWSNFAVRRIFGSKADRLTDYFDDLELSLVLPKLMQYMFARAECENVVWVVAEEFHRLGRLAAESANYEPEQLLYREMKLQALKPVSEETLAAHFAACHKATGGVSSHALDGKGYILIPVHDVKSREPLAYLYFMGVDPRKMHKLTKRLSGDLAAMEKHLGFSLRHWEAQRLAFLDDLTHLYNQKYMSQVLENEIHRAQRLNDKFSVLFMDVDFFKAVNDTRGHWVGSKLLVEVGRILRQHIRRSDYAFRYGGDEFVLVLPGADAMQAKVAAERVRRVVEQTDFVIEGESVKLTLSIGLATYPDHAKTYKDIIKMADEAMYCGKNKSRNIVFVAS